MNPSTVQLLAAAMLVLAIVHTFSTKCSERLAHTRPAHAGIWHLLGEVEVVFGFWALLLVLAIMLLHGKTAATQYLDSRDFTEPLFVFAIMVIAGTRPILYLAQGCVSAFARLLPLPGQLSHYFSVMALVPVLGSFITEPAAMTLAALMLRDKYFDDSRSTRFKYATLGVLFVNISIGGTLTPFAAPPVLMVAAKWQWDLSFMLTQFGWKAAVAVTLNALIVMLLFRHELLANKGDTTGNNTQKTEMPVMLVLTHLAFLVGVVVFAHHPAVFMGLLMFFIGIAHAYEHYQDKLLLREALLVAFFLAGLVVLGGQQQWWLQPVLMGMSSQAVFAGATVLTAFTDNAALTYLGSLVEGLSPEFKYALVAGAVTGGGLTVIANAPNPAGFSILRGKFPDSAIHPGGLLLAALGPTLISACAFLLL